MASVDLVGLTVLALLSEKERHPYEMQTLIRQRRKDYAAGSPRSLYRAVERLERAGMIEKAETARAGNRPERTVYRITPEGFESLQDRLGELVSVPLPEHPAFTAAVGLLARLPAEVAGAALRTRTVLLEGQIAEMEAQRTGLERDLHRLLLLELEYLLELRRAELAWVRRLADDIATGALAWDADAVRADPDLLIRSRKEGPAMS
ncbi:PadR family transcriptional regulator [Nonomuraea phyllanthi]|uniref:PadR family transcriptional regulator n=1 Tax=Nonomuraea phyllanthi TaxID=2219224 RepID=UPI00129370FC|nr:PadR family transcriptional regulator [Nonomuraea phyllanthi]QFY10180.1 PadR family transcriptional regulator [Nonomuraea phyllanthi]